MDVIVPPIPEQEHIVARIEELFSELDKGVETLQTVKQQLKVYRQAVLKEAFRDFIKSHYPREIYEGLLQKNAEDVKSGAGQYFTPRPLIRTMVKCLRPEPMKTIADPCCGSGGFFLAAQNFISNPEN